jgi:hypothetical protein
MAMEVRIGLMLYGYCNGYFGRDSYLPKRIEAIGHDWVVVRERDDTPNFASFEGHPDGRMEELLMKWHMEKEEWE